MIAVITGDIVNSRIKATGKWQPLLKKTLNQYGKEPKDWELYRGDSFQLRLLPAKALLAAMHIKACIRQLSKLDVRMGIGIGEEGYKAKKITASTGSAFIRSGECFDSLKKQTLAIATGDNKSDESLNLMLSLALLTMNNWSETVASVIIKIFENPDKSQLEIAQMMNKSQSSISEALKRGGFEEVKLMEQYYQKEIAKL